MREGRTEQGGPTGCTLADLMALTLGVAVTSCQYWYSWSPQSTTIAGGPAPAWYIWPNHALELLQKSCLALIPVFLQRRWRYGGSLRPVDYWVLVTGFSILFATLWNFPTLGIVYKDSARSSQMLVNMDAYQAWKAGMLALGLLAILALLRTRKQKPEWISGVLIALGWFCLTDVAAIYFQDYTNAWLQSLSLQKPLPNAFLLSVLIPGPLRILTSIPLAIVFVDFVRSRARKRVWVEKLSIAIPLLLTLGGQSFLAAQQLILSPRSNANLAIYQGRDLVSLLLAYMIARRFEPEWRRFLEGPTDAKPILAQPSSRAERIA